MNCEDCLHKNVCYVTQYARSIGYKLDDIDESECDEFMDRAEWVQLPYKIGSDVFCLCSNNDACLNCEHFVVDDDIHYCSLTGVVYPQMKTDCLCNKHFYEVRKLSNQDISLFFSQHENFGKTIFPTEEEAQEKANELNKQLKEGNH